MSFTKAFISARRVYLPVLVLVGVVLSATFASVALAESEVPWWHVVANAAPTELPPGAPARLWSAQATWVTAMQTGLRCRSRSRTSCRRGWSRSG